MRLESAPVVGRSVVFSVVLLAIAPVVATAAIPATQFMKIRTLDTTRFRSPDPAGVFVHPDSGRIVVSDSEAEEKPHFLTNNMFVLDAAGHLEGAYSTLAYSIEPTGVTFSPERGTYFLSDDDAHAIFEVDSSFALLASFSTLADCQDAEDVAWHAGRGTLFVVGGVEDKVAEYTPDGVFVASFPTANFGLHDVEGIALDPASDTLFLVSDPAQSVVRCTPDGVFLEKLGISTFRMTAPQGLSVAPSSDGSGRTSLYVADGRRDNVNDGWIVELSMTKDLCGNGWTLLEPVADAYVESGASAGMNFGTSPVLSVDRSPNRVSYLRFDVGGLGPDVAAATLLLSCVEGSASGGTAWAVASGDFAEASVTYLNRPATTGRAMTRLTRVKAGTVALFDVTGALAMATGGTLTIAIVGGSSDEARYGSREAAFGRPALRVTYR